MLRSALFLTALVAAVTAAPQDGRIVGGEKAKLGEFPYVISLQAYGSHTCGGSILSEKYVLTAAHCIQYFEDRPDVLQIQYGIINIISAENRIGVKRVIKHKNYAPIEAYANDIAILELNDNIILGPNAQPVRLPSADDLPGAADEAATLVGWGQIFTGGPTSSDLHKVNIVMFSHAYCKSKESDYNSTRHVCAGVPEGGRGQCSVSVSPRAHNEFWIDSPRLYESHERRVSMRLRAGQSGPNASTSDLSNSKQANASGVAMAPPSQAAVVQVGQTRRDSASKDPPAPARLKK